ncbi:hypothetical protein [Xanthocytophaga agilis]|uniref:Uncharacterized protein n=1 Tax=Xanthocytophaga agilis TaxID=3048010 RepID=A0AAE3R8F7_9BACT|nr:hypothetical protein [Xanthocytophaga agilis]MDJ1503314.1 hypothetical protein [Xanthocytophaga agilis]
MEPHFVLTDNEFEEQFHAYLLDPHLFTHEAHLRLAWIHIHKYGADAAIDNIRCQLQQFVDHLGATDKYNETVTIAAIKAVYHFMIKSKTDNFRDFITENPRLKYNFRELMAFHYTTDIFNSHLAKEKYLTPELLPFD